VAGPCKILFLEEDKVNRENASEAHMPASQSYRESTFERPESVKNIDSESFYPSSQATSLDHPGTSRRICSSAFNIDSRVTRLIGNSSCCACLLNLSVWRESHWLLWRRYSFWQWVFVVFNWSDGLLWACQRILLVQRMLMNSCSSFNHEVDSCGVEFGMFYFFFGS
jgi:hypothetical protein